MIFRVLRCRSLCLEEVLRAHGAFPIAALSSTPRRVFSSTFRTEGKRVWTQDEDRRLADIVKTQPIHHVQNLQALFPDRSLASIYTRAVKLRTDTSRRPRWTAEEDKILRTGRGDHQTWDQIAEKLPERSRSSLGKRWTYLQSIRGVTQDTSRRRRWQASDMTELLHLRDELGLSWKEIGARLNRGPHAVRAQYVAHVPRESQQGTVIRMPHRFSWSEKQSSRLKQLYESGKKAGQIAELLGRTQRSVFNRLEALRDGDPTQTFRQWRRWTQEETDILQAGLARGLKVKDLGAKLPHRSETSIRDRIKTLRDSK